MNHDACTGPPRQPPRHHHHHQLLEDVPRRAADASPQPAHTQNRLVPTLQTQRRGLQLICFSLLPLSRGRRIQDEAGWASGHNNNQGPGCRAFGFKASQATTAEHCAAASPSRAAVGWSTTGSSAQRGFEAQTRSRERMGGQILRTSSPIVNLLGIALHPYRFWATRSRSLPQPPPSEIITAGYL